MCCASECLVNRYITAIDIIIDNSFRADQTGFYRQPKLIQIHRPDQTATTNEAHTVYVYIVTSRLCALFYLIWCIIAVHTT